MSKSIKNENIKNENIKNTVLEMFEKRNYKNINVVENKIFAEKGKKRICCYITDISKFNTEKTQEYLKIMEVDNVNHSIIIYKHFITSTAKKNIMKLPSNEIINTRMEMFSEKEMSFNITKHRLQPKFFSLSNKDAINFKSKYGKNIPVLFTCDPVARFFDYKQGEIIKITDKKTGYVNYRIVKLKLI